MPLLPAKVSQQIGQDLTGCKWDEAKEWGLIKAGNSVMKKEAIFPRIDPKSLENEVKEEPSAPKASIEPIAEEITIEDFAKLDLRVVEILKAEKVEKTDKLIKLEVKLGEEIRTVVSGIAKHYEPQELVGKKVVLVANLKPVKLRGITSQGMILAASQGEMLEVLQLAQDLPTGSRVK
jgi:methionyl-tRNA synthetase